MREVRGKVVGGGRGVKGMKWNDTGEEMVRGGGGSGVRRHWQPKEGEGGWEATEWNTVK